VTVPALEAASKFFSKVSPSRSRIIGRIGEPAGGTIMTDVDQPVSQQPPSSLDELRASAKGWQTMQFALLGFIGLCGVLKSTATASEPHWLQVTAIVLILLALILACYATFLVGRAAWPVNSARLSAAARAGSRIELRRTDRGLRAGIGLTFVALVLAALAATTSWWPHKGLSAQGREAMLGTLLGLVWIFLVLSAIFDIFRSRDRGWLDRAFWTIFVLVLPFLGVLVYLMARAGRHERQAREAQAQEDGSGPDVRDAATGGGVDELAKLADLRARGAIDDAEFQHRKARILS
jgi:protein-S-isoprenylcysteine O-methyltransferase Ste14